jgi:hypothetical protein
MGWPPCQQPGCDNWPAGSELLLCPTCIQIPMFVHAEHKRALAVFQDEADKLRAENERLTNAIKVFVAASESPAGVTLDESAQLCRSYSEAYVEMKRLVGLSSPSESADE